MAAAKKDVWKGPESPPYKVINYDKQEEVMKKLEVRSEIKYKAGDYKASIKAIRRAEKYY